MPNDQKLLSQVKSWQQDDPDSSTVAETQALLDAKDLETLRQAFGARLQFGTAGLRGLLGPGPGRMNRAVVRQSTWGLCRYLERAVPQAKEQGIVIGRDGRRGSEEFAEEAAGVCAALGFNVHWITPLAPTPLCAFGVIALKAAAGIMITASHNPPEYNGYKVYWGNGAQIIPPHDTGIAAAISEAPGAKAIPSLSLNEAKEQGLLYPQESALSRRYLDAILSLNFRRPGDRSLKIAYTPLHGVGLELSQQAFREAGFCQFQAVPSQAQPDGNFPTVRFPNPEEPGAMDAVLEFAEKHQSELVIAHDPDADRLCAGFRRSDGKMQVLSGNEIGVLLGHHRLVDDPEADDPEADDLQAIDPQASERKASERRATVRKVSEQKVIDPKFSNPAVSDPELSAPGANAPKAGDGKDGRKDSGKDKRLVISTLVSTPLLGKIAEDLGVRYEETLTGFKWIANRAMELEAKEQTRFVFGFEEALGSTTAEVVRDKDGISAALVFAWLASQLRSQGKTIGDRLDEIAQKFGIYASAQHSQTLEPAQMKQIMNQLRENPPESVAGLAVLAYRDLLKGTRRWPDGRKESLSLPKSNVLVFDLAEGARIIARPSGTEPKIKFYFDARVSAQPGEALDEARKRAAARVEELEADFLSRLDR